MRLNQVTAPSLDIAAGIEFYQQLGLQLIVKALPHYARFLCPEGNSTFSLHLVEKMPVGERTSVYFECDDLDEKVTQLIQSGITFDELPEDRSWRWREARLRDPDGNPIILFFAGEDRINPPWRI